MKNNFQSQLQNPSSDQKQRSTDDRSIKEPENVIYKLVKKKPERKIREYFSASKHEKGFITHLIFLINVKEIRFKE